MNPQGNQIFAPLKETIPLVADAMKRAQDETGEAKLFLANITADDHYEMIARGEFILETFGEFADHVAFLVDGLYHWPCGNYHGASPLPEPVFALSPCRSRSRNLTANSTWLHRFCTGENGTGSRCIRYSYGHYELRQNGGREVRYRHGLYDHE